MPHVVELHTLAVSVVQPLFTSQNVITLYNQQPNNRIHLYHVITATKRMIHCDTFYFRMLFLYDFTITECDEETACHS